MATKQLQAQDHLDKLSIHVNTVLVQIGKVFRDVQKGDARASQKAIPQAIAQANQRLHESLDEIEIDILKAKAVFERDLTILRQKRARRERALNDLASSQKASPVPGNLPGLLQESLGSPAKAELFQPEDDLVSLNGANTVAIGSATPNLSEDIAMDDAEPVISLDNATDATQPQATIELLQDLQSGNAVDDPFQSISTSTDFDSMFGIRDQSKNLQTANIELDFSPGNGFDLTSTDNGFGVSTQDDIEDIDSLLPGIEHYVNAGDVSENGNAGPLAATNKLAENDFNLLGLDVNVDGAGAAKTVEQNRQGGAGDMSSKMDIDAGDSNFDMYFDDLGDVGDSGMVNADDLDDWFNMP